MNLLDVNQDGHGDLVILYAACMGNCRVSIWPYSVKLDRLVRSPTLSHLANVGVPAVRHVRRWFRCSAIDERPHQ
ncbi:MAG: hypothetical protein ACI9U2_003471 [Bradymonadia bacterium]